MVIIYTSSRRAVLRRFAALLIAPQRFVCYNAAIRHATRFCASRYDVFQRAASHRNDLFVTTLRTPRLGSARLRVSRCAAIQRYDLLCTTQRTPLLTAPPCIVLPLSTGRRSATRLNSTICLLLLASVLLGALLRSASQSTSPQFNSTICLLQGNSTQPNATRLASTRRGSLHFSSTQRFVCYNDDSTNCGSTYRPAWLRTAPRLNSTQRTETLTRKTNVQTFETNFGNV